MAANNTTILLDMLNFIVLQKGREHAMDVSKQMSESFHFAFNKTNTCAMFKMWLLLMGVISF